MNNAMTSKASGTAVPLCSGKPESVMRQFPDASASFRQNISEQLRVRAFQFEEIVERRLIDANGIPRSALIRGTMKPFPEGYFAGGSHDYLKVKGYEHIDYAGMFNYENSGMVMGELLSAMCARYRASGDEEARRKAARIFAAVRQIYEMSQRIAKGFFCKPWAGRLSDEISSDQCLYILFALNEYYPLASEREQKQICEMTEGIASFWMTADYTYKYYGHTLRWQKCRFLIFLALAYKYSGRRIFLEEFRSLEAEKDVRAETPFHATMDIRGEWRPEWEKTIGKQLLRQSSPSVLSAALSVIPLLEAPYADRDFYLEKLRKIIDFGRCSLAPDASTYGYLLCDRATGVMKPLDRIVQYHPDPQWHFLGFVAPYRCGGMGGAMFAAAAQNAAHLFSDTWIASATRDILMKLHAERLTWFDDPDGIFPPELRWMTDVFSGDAVGSWLWAYWKSVERGGFGK